MDKISQWMDGELSGHETQKQLTRVKQDAELHHSWGIFHLIGDVMRGERALSREFEQRVATRLASEPAVLVWVLVLQGTSRWLEKIFMAVLKRAIHATSATADTEATADRA